MDHARCLCCIARIYFPAQDQTFLSSSDIITQAGRETFSIKVYPILSQLLFRIIISLDSSTS